MFEKAIVGVRHAVELDPERRSDKERLENLERERGNPFSGGQPGKNSIR